MWNCHLNIIIYFFVDEKYLSVINSLIMTCVAGSGSGFGK